MKSKKLYYLESVSISTKRILLIQALHIHESPNGGYPQFWVRLQVHTDMRERFNVFFSCSTQCIVHIPSQNKVISMRFVPFFELAR